MQPIIKDRVAYLVPQGFVDGNNAPLILDPVGAAQAAARGAEALVVSLERVVAFNNRGVAHFAQMFEMLRLNHGVRSALYGYSAKLYEQMIHFFGDRPPVDLFENSRVLALFLGRLDTKTRVLIYARDAIGSGLMAVRLKELGYTACEVVKNRAEFLKKVEEKAYDVTIDQSQLAQSGAQAGRTVRGNTVIYTAEANFDEYAERFDRRYHLGSLAIGFTMFVFDAAQMRLITPRGIDFLVTLSVEAAEYGASIALAGVKDNQIPAKLLEPLVDTGVLIVPDLAKLIAESDGQQGAVLRKYKAPSKELIAQTGVFIDATVHTLEALSGVIAVRGNPAVSTFGAPEGEALIGAACGFYGALTGMLVLAFPVSIAGRACRLLMGEGNEPHLLEAAVGDLSGVVMGRIAAMLAAKRIELSLTQSRTFVDSKSLRAMLGARRGVMIPVRFGNEAFYFFLSR